MSFWLYHEQMPLCRVRRLVDDRAQSGTVVLALPAHLLSDMSVLTGELGLYEDRNDHLESIQGLAFRLAGDEVELTIMTMSGWRHQNEERFNDDWLLIDGQPLCAVDNCVVSVDGCPRGPHVRCSIPAEALRRLNYRRRQLGALRQVQQSNIHSTGCEAVGLMVPLVYDGPLGENDNRSQIELLRLRHRLRMPVECELADAGQRSVTVIGHVGQATALRKTRRTSASYHTRPTSAVS